MSDDQDVATAPQTPEPTAAQIKEQIEAKQRELAAQAAPTALKPEPAQAPEPVPPAPAAEPAPADKPAEPALESSAAEATGPAQGKEDKPEWKKWIEKKGLLKSDGTFDVEKSVRSQRELERELTKQRMSAQAQGPAQPVQPPMQSGPYPAPVYPQQPQSPSEEEIAKRYNLDPDDLRRVGPLAADIAASVTAQRLGPLVAEMNRLQREVARNSELQGLKEDPAFQDPRVQFEMHRILESDPSILQTEPAPYRHAFNEALRSMGRRILEEGQTPKAESVAPSGQPLARKPPVTAGGGGTTAKASGRRSAQGPVDANSFASLPLAEKRKMLTQLGALPNE